MTKRANELYDDQRLELSEAPVCLVSRAVMVRFN